MQSSNQLQNSSELEARSSKLFARRSPLLISFSGVDGSGKSTQIANLIDFAQKKGLTTKLLAFWDDVVVLSRYREGFVHKVYGSERGIGAPDKPVNRRDKNVRRWYLSLARHGLYLLDALHLVRVIARARRSGADVIILDRYIYDELANLPLRNSFTKAFVRLLSAVVPQPDIAYILDADPEVARARKPEYPVEFMRLCRNAYLQLAPVLGNVTVIRPLLLQEAEREVESVFVRALDESEAPRLNTVSAAQLQVRNR
jgi:thymidylate kinase